MKNFDNLLRGLNSYMTYLGRARAREILLRSSDRLLEDAGFSRELLESGVKAWPWRMPAVAHTPVDLDPVGSDSAVRELQTFTDRELHDLGIARGSIPEAVMWGREGIERNVA